MDFTYFNAIYTVENALSKVKDEKGMKRVEKFLKQESCPACQGTRLSDAARAPRLRGISLARACQMTLSGLMEWVRGVPASLPEEMRPMARSICESFESAARRLMDLGLGYLTLDRASLPSPRGSGSGCSWPAPCGTERQASCMCWMSRPSACIPPISRGSTA
jgi:excinuclease ABC subunit A